MRVCFIVSEYFEWGAYGGYGTITRSVAEGLVERGHEVFALVPRRTEVAKREQRDIELIAGVTVVAIPHSYPRRWIERLRYKIPCADLYVSTDPRFDSWMAMHVNPRAKHCIWLIDPMRFDEFWSLHADSHTTGSPDSRIAARAIFETLAWFGRRAVHRADAVISQTERLAREGARFFRTDHDVIFAPNPVALPDPPVEKDDHPLILFLGRFDRQKQPEVFFELARELPECEFVAAGRASDPELDRDLRRRYGAIENLQLPGLVTGPTKDELLRRTWILCNTSLREGLPRSIQEGLSYGTALLARVDPDRLVTRFGSHVPDGDFQSGLRHLLEDRRWEELGRAGRQHVANTYERKRVLDIHEAIYQAVVDSRDLSAVDL